MPRGQSRATLRLHSRTAFGYRSVALALCPPLRGRLRPRHQHMNKEPKWAERPPVGQAEAGAPGGHLPME